MGNGVTCSVVHDIQEFFGLGLSTIAILHCSAVYVPDTLLVPFWASQNQSCPSALFNHAGLNGEQWEEQDPALEDRLHLCETMP
jgi:hypothetical protein